MSGNFREPKLLESNREGECALCGKEFERGSPIWWFNGRAFCGDHPKAELTEGEGIAPQQRAPSPSPSSPSTLIFDPELLRTLERIVNAIDLQTEVLKGMRKDNNERR